MRSGLARSARRCAQIATFASLLLTRVRILAALGLLTCASVSHATVITYTATSVGGAAWRYDYTLTNDTRPLGLDYFNLSFDRALYANLRDSTAPEGWDVILLQPDDGIPADGVFDALALGDVIALGATLAGFGVVFDFLGTGLPGEQPFSVLDPFTFEVIESGAAADVTVVVSEPGTIALLCAALLLSSGYLLRRGRRCRDARCFPPHQSALRTTN